jgi:hypothetical protein
MISKAVYARLNGHAALTAVIGTRLYPNALPQDTDYPAVTWQLIDAEHTHSLNGVDGLVLARVQIDCFASGGPDGTSSTPYGDVQDLAEIVRKRMSAWRGTSGGVVVHHSHLLSHNDLVDGPFDSGDVTIHRVSQDYTVAYTEATS